MGRGLLGSMISEIKKRFSTRFDVTFPKLICCQTFFTDFFARSKRMGLQILGSHAVWSHYF